MSDEGAGQGHRVADDFLWGVPMLVVGLLIGGFGALQVVVDSVANGGYGGSGLVLSGAAIVGLLLGALVSVAGLAMVTNAVYRTAQNLERICSTLDARPVAPDAMSWDVTTSGQEAD